MIDRSVRQIAQMPLIRPAGQHGPEPQPPSRQPVAFRISEEKEGIVQLDFTVRTDHRADPEGHFLRALLQVDSVKAEHRLQRARRLQRPVSDDPGKLRGFRPGDTDLSSVLRFFRFGCMRQPQHGPHRADHLLSVPLAGGQQILPLPGNTDPEVSGRDGPSVPFLCDLKLCPLRFSGGAGHQFSARAQPLRRRRMAAPLDGSVRPPGGDFALQWDFPSLSVQQRKGVFANLAFRPVSAEHGPPAGLSVLHQMQLHSLLLSGGRSVPSPGRSLILFRPVLWYTFPVFSVLLRKEVFPWPMPLMYMIP